MADHSTVEKPEEKAVYEESSPAKKAVNGEVPKTQVKETETLPAVFVSRRISFEAKVDNPIEDKSAKMIGGDLADPNVEKPEKGSAEKKKVLPDAGTTIVTNERRSDDDRNVLEIPNVEETCITAQLDEAKFAEESIKNCETLVNYGDLIQIEGIPDSEDFDEIGYDNLLVSKVDLVNKPESFGDEQMGEAATNVILDAEKFGSKYLKFNFN